jgi:hypothetical protein
MTKTYQSPITKAIDIQVVHLMTTSNELNAESDTPEVTISEGQTDNFGARQYNVWDDEL